MKKRILISALLALTLFSTAIGQMVIRGIVMDAQNGQALSGANIQDSRTGKGTAAATDGKFTLDLGSDKQTTLRISFLGYEPEELSVNKKSGASLIEIKLSPTSINSNAVVVTGTKNQRRIREIPGRTEWLTAKQLEAIPATQADDYLRTLPGIQVSREHGILDHNSTVSMRGLGGSQQGRYLVLMDGVPMNKADGGSVNWNSINTDDIMQVEVAKGPGSSLYGGNAMGGVMNYIRRKPSTPLEGSAHVEYGSLNTRRGRFSIGGNPASLDNKFYWSVQGFGALSDGYNQVPEADRDSTDVAGGLQEWGGGIRAGYRINKNHQVEISSGYWSDRRGSGTKIFSETGTFFGHQVWDNSVKYTGRAGKTNWSAVGYITDEDYERLNESIKPKGNSYTYTSYSVTSDRKDKGIMLHADHRAGINLISVGGDYKDGSVLGKDVYTTSSDVVNNMGKLRSFSAYIQDQLTVINEKLFLVGGLRYDRAVFYDGAFFVTDPTSATSILGELQKLELEKNVWSELSPKLALKYSSPAGIGAYISYGHGFRPSILDDMCRSGFISGGFKRANPYLGPEKLNNFEIGADIPFLKRLNFSASAYYSMGKDFIYLVSSGDSILQGTKLKPLLEAQNISGVRIMGMETSLRAELGNGLTGYLNYAYTNALVSDYQPTFGKADLKGKVLVYVPEHQVSAGMTWRNRWVNLHVQGSWLSEQWMDDVNTVSIPAFFKLDARIWKEYRGFQVFINGQNLTNTVYLEGHGLLSLGRFITGGIGYQF